MKIREENYWQRISSSATGITVLCLALLPIFLTGCGTVPVRIQSCAPDETLLVDYPRLPEAATEGELLEQKNAMNDDRETDAVMKGLLRKQIKRCYEAVK